MLPLLVHGVPRLAALAAMLVCAMAPSVASSGSATTRTPAPTGTYEAYSPITMSAVGPISSARARKLLGRWLSVTTNGDRSEIVFEPEGAVHWKLRYGPYGPLEKTTFVDGEAWTKSTFQYNAHGNVVSKSVTGAGLSHTLSYRYRADSQGRVTERIESGGERWRVTYGARIVADTLDGHGVVRRDAFDLAGRLLETRVGRPATGADARVLRYQRDASGRLLGILKKLGKSGARRADPSLRDPAVASVDVVHASSHVERFEAWLLLGAPKTHSVSGRGTKRVSHDDFSSPQCWLNQQSSIVFDAADRAMNGEVGCICGFCVAVGTPLSAPDAIGFDEHFSAGPWLDIDGVVITADHHVLTPDGPRAAGSLRAGDLVTGPGGTQHRVRSIQQLSAGPERLGTNLRTRSGHFVAGNLLLQSETPRACRP